MFFAIVVGFVLDCIHLPTLVDVDIHPYYVDVLVLLVAIWYLHQHVVLALLLSI
jgi:hypothetical protein